MSGLPSALCPLCPVTLNWFSLSKSNPLFRFSSWSGQYMKMLTYKQPWHLRNSDLLNSYKSVKQQAGFKAKATELVQIWARIIQYSISEWGGRDLHMSGGLATLWSLFSRIFVISLFWSKYFWVSRTINSWDSVKFVYNKVKVLVSVSKWI